MFKEQTEKAIRSRMLEKINLDLYKGEGSDLYQLVTPLAMELASFYTWLDYFKEVIFGRQLDENFVARAESFGVFRKNGEKAKGELTIISSDATTIESGTRLMSSTGLFYELDDEVSLATAGTIKVAFTAEEVGVLYNIKANDLKFVADIPTITKISHAALKTGIDIETLEQLQERFLEKLRNPSSSGNVADYQRWAKSIEGVVSVDVYRLHNGAGTVKVVASGENGVKLEDNVRDELENKIRELAPIGAFVTVKTTTNKFIGINIKGLSVIENSDVDLVKSKINEAIRRHLLLTKPGSIVVLKQLLGVIMSVEGVLDVTNILLNNANMNLDLLDEEKGILGEVVYSA